MVTGTVFFQKVLDKASCGERITQDEGLELLKNAALLDLGAVANKLTCRLHPESTVTYIVDRNINYTNICVSRCEFCAFSRDPVHPEAYVLTKDELYRKIDETIKLGGVQILLQGGHHPDYKLDWYEDLLSWIKSNFKVHVHGFSPAEIQHFARFNRLSVRDVLIRLKNAGLDTIPGGGAEILVDRVRNLYSKNRCSSSEWLDVMRTAHELGITTTATMVIGHLETLAERIEHLQKLRDLQDETGGFSAFIMWTMQTNNTKIDHVPSTGGHEYLRNLAVARIFLDNFKNIQASWVTQGEKIGAIALHFGANDMGSTMIEENVVWQTGTRFRMSEADLRHLIMDAGFTPKRRNCYYNLLE